MLRYILAVSAIAGTIKDAICQSPAPLTRFASAIAPAGDGRPPAAPQAGTKARRPPPAWPRSSKIAPAASPASAASRDSTQLRDNRQPAAPVVLGHAPGQLEPALTGERDAGQCDLRPQFLRSPESLR